MPRANRNIKDGKRRCTGCDTWLLADLDHFHKQKGGALGLRSVCKKCDKKHTYAYREEHIEEISQYNKDYAKRTEVRRMELRSLRYSIHGEKLRAYHRNWQKLPASRVRSQVYHSRRKAHKLAAEGSHTYQDIQDMYKRQKGKCYYCKVKVGKKFDVDHVVPLSRGGRNDPSNLVIACEFCNGSKHAKMPHEWPQGGRLL